MTIGPTGRRLIDALNRAAHTAAGAHRTEPPVTDPTSAVLAEVAAERRRQDDRWGEQNHPDGTGLPIYWHSARRHRHSAERAAAAGLLAWRDVLLEETYEALAEGDPERLRAELVQVSAVAVAWIEAIDRRTEQAGQ